MNKFTEDVRAMVEASTGKEVVIDEVAKVNEIKTAISIRDGNLGANFYIEDFYEDGMSAEYCANMIVEAYENCPKLGFDVENYDFSFEAIKDKLIARLVGIERNKKLLESVAYKDMGCGLAIVPAIVPVIEPNGEFLVNVSKTLAEHYGYDVDKLVDTALVNDANNKPAALMNLMGAVFGVTQNIFEMEDPSGAVGDGMLVLTNEETVMGASVIFHKGVLDKTRKIIGDDFYVLPSSIHEVIIVPDHAGNTAEELKAIVNGANRNVVDEKDILSDDVYFFNGELRKVA